MTRSLTDNRPFKIQHQENVEGLAEFLNNGCFSDLACTANYKRFVRLRLFPLFKSILNLPVKRHRLYSSSFPSQSCGLAQTVGNLPRNVSQTIGKYTYNVSQIIGNFMQGFSQIIGNWGNDGG